MTDIDDQNEDVRGRGSGASIAIKDPRVTKAIGFAFAIFQAAIIGLMAWIGSTLVSVRESMASLAATSSITLASIKDQVNRNDLRDDRQDVAIGANSREIAEVRGKTFRGDGSAKDFQHGN